MTTRKRGPISRPLEVFIESGAAAAIGLLVAFGLFAWFTGEVPW